MISTNSWNAYFIVYQEFFFSRRTKKIEEKLSQMDFFFNLKQVLKALVFLRESSKIELLLYYMEAEYDKWIDFRV